MLTGVLLMLWGTNVTWMQRRTGSLPPALPLQLAGVGVAGAVMMPRSGFWALLAAALLASGGRRANGPAVDQEARVNGGAHARVRRVSVADPIAVARRYDYADAFELRLDEPDRCSPEEWVRAGVDAVPAWIKRIAGHADGFGSARIVASDAAVVVLEDSDWLMDTTMVGRNVDGNSRVLTTLLRYRRPLLARAIWALVGVLHRRTARRVVAAGLRQARA